MKEIKKGNATFIKLNKEYVAPIPKIERGLNFIKYGDRNNYPDFMVDMLASSGLHRSIIEKKVSMILGKGLNVEDVNNDTLNFIAQVNQFESLDSLLEKCVYDLEWYGGYYLQITWKGDKIDQIFHMDPTRMRVGPPNEFGYIESYYYFDDLTIPMTNFMDTSQAIHFPTFGLSSDRSEPQILFVKKYSPTNKYYGSPIYEASMLDIQTYSEISNFHNSNLSNSFSPGFMIFFTGTPPSDELQDSIVKSLKEKYTGSENTGKPMVFFLEEDMAEPQVKPIETNDLDKQFESLLSQIINNITISHQIPRQVIGLETTGSLGGSKEMLEATEIFKTNYVIPQQNLVLNSFNLIGRLNGLDELQFVNPSPNIMLFNMSELSKILTTNELREWLGYEEIEDENDNDALAKKETEDDEQQ
jgi:hypothetical protein